MNEPSKRAFGPIDVGLDSRAARNIVDRRGNGLATIAALDAVPFVGRSALGKLLEFARKSGFLTDVHKIFSFNIRWYGLNGNLFNPLGSEARNDTIREFLSEHLADFDIMLFQEIVDLDLFFTEIAGDLECVTYDGFTGKHQHIALCHTSDYVFVPEPDDDNFALESLNTGRIRPGLHGQLRSASDDRLIAHFIGVHLKANEVSTQRRLEQAAILRDRVAELGVMDDAPVMLLGDFNTHRTDVTGLADNDEVLVDDILNEQKAVPLNHVDLPVTFTYREKDGTAFRLDHSWLSDEIKLLDVKVPGPCDLDFSPQSQQEIDIYHDTVSDHCPLALTLQM